MSQWIAHGNPLGLRGIYSLTDLDQKDGAPLDVYVTHTGVQVVRHAVLSLQARLPDAHIVQTDGSYMAKGPSSASVAQDLEVLVACIDRQIMEIGGKIGPGGNGTGARGDAAQDAAGNAQLVRAAVNALAQHVGSAGRTSW